MCPNEQEFGCGGEKNFGNNIHENFSKHFRNSDERGTRKIVHDPIVRSYYCPVYDHDFQNNFFSPHFSPRAFYHDTVEMTRIVPLDTRIFQ